MTLHSDTGDFMRVLGSEAPLESIMTTSLADEIALRLESAILEGDLPLGTRLPQEDLSRRFGVSRTPIREALRKLQAQQLVVMIPNKGAAVRIPSRKEIDEIYALRAELEGFACELACRNVTQSIITDLDITPSMVTRIISDLKMKKINENTFNLKASDATRTFHHIVRGAAGSDRLSAILKDLEILPFRGYCWHVVQLPQESHEHLVEEHRRIRDALDNRDAARARREAQEHVLHARKLLLAYLDGHELWRKHSARAAAAR